MADETKLRSLRDRLRECSPRFAAPVLDRVAPRLVIPGDREPSRKIVNDPIWNITELDPLAVALLDTPLLQRLRYVRQLGLAHLVYPGAHHSRLEHSIGARETALRMFESIMPAGKVEATDRVRLRLVISAAALMHDSGHVAFSHAGERVLDAAVGDDRSAVWEKLVHEFPDPLADRLDPKPPPGSAELLSVLFVLSEPFEDLVSTVKRPLQISEREILAIAGLIMGRPGDLTIGSCNYQFLRSLVSGDLDADKLDYVARDAFYSGIPISADIHRILTNLEGVSVRAATMVDPPLELAFGSQLDEYLLFGIRQPALSAVEMFVASRAYLFERIYGHHKIRAAELLLERSLSFLTEAGAEHCTALIDFLLEPGGDDVLLHRLATADIPNDLTDQPGLASKLALRVQQRRLPHRALAISERTCRGGERSYLRLHRNLEDDRTDIEQEIRSLLNLEPDQLVMVDRPARNPISENPQVFVRDYGRNDLVRTIQHAVNIEQQANSYQGLKQIDWIFADGEVRVRVAAASSMVIAELYGAVPNEDAVAKPKIPLDMYRAAVDELMENAAGTGDYVLARQLLAAEPNRLVTHPRALEGALPLTGSADSRREIAAKLAEQLNTCELPATSTQDLAIASQVLRAVGAFAERRNSQIVLTEESPEASLSEQLRAALENDDELMSVFRVIEEAKRGAGYVDLLMVPNVDYPSIVVELKAPGNSFQTAVDQSAGQPLQYIDHNTARIAILLIAFESEPNVLVQDTYQVWRTPDASSPLAVICLGVRTKPSKAPSRSGKVARKV